MKLAVRPEDLHGAADALARCARHLDDARDGFARAAARNVPDLGRNAVEAAGESAARAEREATTIADDLDQLARALRMLAQLYAAVDATALHR